MEVMEARARRTDPETSHEAARAITSELSLIQRRVESYAFGKGMRGFCDAELAHDLEDPGSTLRTRRAELAARNIIIDSGRCRRFGGSARNRIVWIHCVFADNPPPVIEGVPKRPARADIDAVLKELDDFAKLYQSASVGGILVTAASLIRRMAR